MSDRSNLSEDDLLRILNIARKAAGLADLDTLQDEKQDTTEADNPTEKVIKAIRKGAGLE